MLSAATLPENTCTVKFKQETNVKYHLMEVDDAQLLSAINSGEMISFQGCDKDPLTLCTSSCTFQVQQLCISNSLLLCQVEENDKSLIAKCNSSYLLEPRITKPNFEKLEEYLKQTLYNIPDEVETAQLFTLSDIYELIPASREQINSYLEKEGTISIDRFIRQISPKCLGRFFEVLMMNAALSEKIIINCSIEECLGFMNESEEFPITITDHILRTHSLMNYLDRKKICKLYAKQILLASPNHRMPWEQFERIWQDVCGDFQPDPMMLLGLAIRERNPYIIILFDSDDLPNESVEARLASLFIRRPKWMWEEAKEYIRSLLDNPDDEKSCEAVMLKFCRVSSSPDNTQKYATSKIPLQPF